MNVNLLNQVAGAPYEGFPWRYKIPLRKFLPGLGRSGGFHRLQTLLPSSRGVNESAIKNQQVRRLSAASCALSRIRAIRFCSTGFSRGSRRSPLGWADLSRSRAEPGLRRWRDLCSNRSERRTNTARDADHQVLFLLNETLLSWTHRSLLKRSVLWRAHHLEHNDRLLETRLPAERLINEWAARHSHMRWRAADHFPNARYLFGEVEWPP